VALLYVTVGTVYTPRIT